MTSEAVAFAASRVKLIVHVQIVLAHVYVPSAYSNEIR